MKKLKIFLPSIALVVVLAFSITIGVFAATSVTFTISSTVSFISPDLDDIIIKAYIGQEVKADKLAFTYNSTNSGDQEVVWDFKDNHKLEFTRANIGDDYSSAYLTFVITSGVAMQTYAYFVDNLTDKNHMTSDVLTSDKQTTKDENNVDVPLPLVNVTFVDDSVADAEGVIHNDSISVVEAKVGETLGEAIITIRFDLIPEVTSVNDSVNFNYTLIVDKSGPVTQ